jgi:RNA polymerase sigma-70 factor (ECF subfamily)
MIGIHRAYYKPHHPRIGGMLDSVASSAPQMLERLQQGDSSALNELVTVLYDELHRIASRHMRAERPGHTLQTTALVHETYVRLFGESSVRYANRVHFLAVASRVMRQVLVDYARARSTRKRSGEAGPAWTISLSEVGEVGIEPRKLLELDQALNALASEDKSLAEVIEMRYFGGMTAEETAEALGVSVHIVRHDIRLAQAWLRRELTR